MLLLPSLLLLATSWPVVIADSNSCSSSATISSQSDADTYANCDQIDGSVTISSSASGSIILNNVTEIKGTFTAEGASGLTTLAAPDLETLEGALTVDSMSSLSNLSMNSLSEVSSGITIIANPKLKHLEFEDLEEVDGQLKLTGSFSSVSLPSLDQVKGQTTIRGGSSMSCTALNNLQSEDVYHGGYSCSTSSGSSLSTGAKAGIAIGVIVGVLLILFLMWWVFRQRRVRQKRRRPSQTPASISPPVLKDEKQSTPQYQPIPSSDLSPKVPRKPVGLAPALLDGRSIYEAAYPASPIPVYHELDAGPVFSTHQRPINSES
ncbi:hypothetical protein N7513_013284 [Penicillium frequentans]|nr:hypothetical protein N7513_013284 [Penicillium glabrum]